MIRDDNAWDYRARLETEKLRFVGVKDLSTLANMLYKKRIDIVIHDKGDFLDYVKMAGLESPTYSEETPLWSDPIVLSCHDTPRNTEFVRQLDPLIEELNATGKLGYYYHKATTPVN